MFTRFRLRSRAMSCSDLGVARLRKWTVNPTGPVEGLTKREQIQVRIRICQAGFWRYQDALPLSLGITENLYGLSRGSDGPAVGFQEPDFSADGRGRCDSTPLGPLLFSRSRPLTLSFAGGRGLSGRGVPSMTRSPRSKALAISRLIRDWGSFNTTPIRSPACVGYIS